MDEQHIWAIAKGLVPGFANRCQLVTFVGACCLHFNGKLHGDILDPELKAVTGRQMLVIVPCTCGV